MRDLQKLFTECINELEVIDIPFSENIVRVTANNRLSSTYGKCKRVRNNNGTFDYQIEIASFLLNDSLPDKVIRSTIMHEIVHTCDGCFDHGKLFHKYGALISDCYDVEITTYVSNERMRIVEKAGVIHKRKQPKNDSWKFKCVGCGNVWQYSRKPKFVKSYEPTTMIIQGCHCPYCKGKIQMLKHLDISKLARVYNI